MSGWLLRDAEATGGEIEAEMSKRDKLAGWYVVSVARFSRSPAVFPVSPRGQWAPAGWSHQ